MKTNKQNNSEKKNALVQGSRSRSTKPPHETLGTEATCNISDRAPVPFLKMDTPNLPGMDALVKPFKFSSQPY